MENNYFYYIGKIHDSVVIEGIFKTSNLLNTMLRINQIEPRLPYTFISVWQTTEEHYHEFNSKLIKMEG